MCENDKNNVVKSQSESTESKKNVKSDNNKQNIKSDKEKDSSNIERNEKSQKQWTMFTVPVIILILLGLRIVFDADKFFADIGYLINIISFVLWGFAIAFILDPLVTFFMKKVFKNLKKGKRSISMLVTYLIFLGIVTFLIIFILPAVGENISETAKKLPGAIDTTQKWWNSMLQKLYGKNDNILNKYLIAFGEKLNKSINDFFNSDKLNQSLKNIGTGILTTAWGATQAIIHFLVGFVLSIYMLSDKENMLRNIKRFTYAAFSKDTADKIITSGDKTKEIFRKFIIGKGAASLIVGVITFIFITIINAPVPLLQGTIFFISNMIPTIGPIIGAIPCLLLTIFDNPINALWLLIFSIVIQQVDGMYLSPKILGDSLGLKPFYIIVGVLIGSSIAGIIGAFLGAPTFAVIGYFINSFTDKKLKEKELAKELPKPSD